jgi:hypothetical protein
VVCSAGTEQVRGRMIVQHNPPLHLACQNIHPGELIENLRPSRQDRGGESLSRPPDQCDKSTLGSPVD